MGTLAPSSTSPANSFSTLPVAAFDEQFELGYVSHRSGEHNDTPLGCTRAGATWARGDDHGSTRAPGAEATASAMAAPAFV